MKWETSLLHWQRPDAPLSLSLSVLICKRLKGALSPGSSASFHAWFTLICLIGHKDLEMAHLSLENVLIFLWHCYVEVFDFSLPLTLLPPPPFLHLHLSPTRPRPRSVPLVMEVHEVGLGLGESCSSATVCLSAFRFEPTQQKQVFHEVWFSDGRHWGLVCLSDPGWGAEQPSASNHKDLMFKLRRDWPSSLASRWAAGADKVASQRGTGYKRHVYRCFEFLFSAQETLVLAMAVWLLPSPRHFPTSI